MAKEQYTKIPRPADFEPETHFPDNWAVKGKAGKPRCPAWSGQQGAQCKQVAGAGTERLGEVGYVCKHHGGASKGPPKGSKNAVNPDRPHSEYVRIKDLPKIKAFAALSDEEKADLLGNISLSRIEAALNVEEDSDPDKTNGRLIALIAAANSSLRTKVAVRRLAAEVPPDPDENLTDEQLERELFGDAGTVPGAAEE